MLQGGFGFDAVLFPGNDSGRGIRDRSVAGIIHRACGSARLLGAQKKTRPAWLGLDGSYQVNSVVCRRLLSQPAADFFALLHKRLSHGEPTSVTTRGLENPLERR